MDYELPQGSLLYLLDARGVYIPRDFADGTRADCISGVDADTLDILRAGPEHDLYWDAWTEVLDRARVTNPDTGAVYTVHHDGDCWLIPAGAEWPEG